MSTKRDETWRVSGGDLIVGPRGEMYAVEDPITALNELEAERTRLETIAQFLFARLDDIDTIDDAAKDDDHSYRVHVRRIQRRRFEVATTDGYTVTWKDSSITKGEEPQ